MKLASVVLDIPTQTLDAPYTYAVGGDVPDVEVGCAVLVPFGRRQAVGFVVGVGEYDDAGVGVGDGAAGRAVGAGKPARATGGLTLPEGLDPHKLKGIARVLSKPYFDEEGAACAQFLAERYVAPLSACVRLFTPPGGVPRMVRTREGYWRLEEPTVGEVDDRWVTLGPAADGFTPRKNAVKQASVIDVVRRGDVRMAELALEFGNVSSTVKALAEKGVVRVELRRRMRGLSVPSVADATDGQVDAAAPRGTSSCPSACGSCTEAHFTLPSGQSEAPREASLTLRTTSDVSDFTPSPKPALTSGQQEALSAIEDACAAARGEVVLVDGVTGSGKTEVYLQAIEATLAEGRRAIVLVPEISLTPQTVARFRGRFGNAVAVMHSRMSQGERYDQWDFIRSGEARVVVGARSALFTPMSNVGLIVIDEEHEGSYKQDSSPRYVARDVAAWMVARSGGVLVLGSATPSVEALHAAATDARWRRVALPERANGRPLPAVEVVDMAAEFHGGSRSMFSRRLVEALGSELSQGRKAVMLLNQRGFAKFLLCRDCGFVPECPSCSTSLTYHEQGAKLVCHHCGYTVAAPPRCPACESPYLKKFGAGTQRVEAELRALMDGLPGVGAGVPIVRMDADTTRAKGAHQALLEQFAAADAAVLLGTQMIAKGLDFDDVTLVGVINADTQLHLPDYRAGERTFALIEQVAGRAGRANLPGRVLVQTYEADNVAVRAAASYDRATFLRAELPKRRALGYPPYVRMARVLVWGANEADVERVARDLHAQLVALVHDFGGDSWQVLPAGPCVLRKLRNTFRWHIVVKCPREDDVSVMLARLIRARKPDKSVNVAVDVDPVDLL
ncbi:MAG: primosomal protein N' [Eggerthellaceae bacterium]|nr:primosomal protein N' [Eggerthellaceae bacterium]